MVSLTYTPPISSSVASAAAQKTDQHPLLGILSAYAPGAVGDSAAQTLRNATNPGNILTGTISSAIPGRSFSLVTQSGAEITLPYPPQITLSVGSTITLRMIFDGSAPQATLLAVDGRPVLIKASDNTDNAALLNQPAAMPRGPAIGAAPRTATPLPLLSFEDETALESAISAPKKEINPALIANGTLSETPIIGVLQQPSPARLGQTPLAVGMRYLLSLGDTADDATLLASLPRDQESAFIPQSALLAGRILPSSTPGQTLVETALGTIALAVSMNLVAGAPVRLRIAAVAPPSRKTLPTLTADDVPVTLTEEILASLSENDPSMERYLTGLFLPTDAALLDAAWRFLSDPLLRQEAQTIAKAIKDALAKAGKATLAGRFGAATQHLGEKQPQILHDGWTAITLPYLGSASNEPIRLYRKKNGEDADKNGKKRGGERIVLEVDLRNLGALQFDGLVRERRFDMVLRTEQDFENALRSGIEARFRDAISACGWAGDIAFGRIAKFPLLNSADPVRGIGLSV